MAIGIKDTLSEEQLNEKKMLLFKAFRLLGSAYGTEYHSAYNPCPGAI